MSKVSSQFFDLDPVNRRILEILDADPRSPVAHIAREVAMSAPAVRERIATLESAGVIRGYRLVLDHGALGLPVSAWVRVKPSPGELARVAALLPTMPEVSEAYRVTGEDCFLVRIFAPSIQDIESLLDRLLIHGVTNSALIVSTTVAPRSVLGGIPE